jgi:hypothetical protein
MQMWQQQNADVAWNAPQGGVQADDRGWGEWPYEGESWRAITGYAGSSMMDGVVPDGNISDDPNTWSPSLSDMEDAADDVVHGRQSGELRFIRAGGDNLLLEVEALPGAQFSSFEVGESSSRLSSMIVVPPLVSDTADHVLVLHADAVVSFGFEQFKLLISFLGNNIYNKVKFISGGTVESALPLVCMDDLSLDCPAVFSTEFRDNFFGASVLKLTFGTSCLDIASAKFITSLLHPAPEARPSAFLFLSLGEDGGLCWAPIDLESGVSNSSWAGEQDLASSTGLQVGPVVGPRRPGRPRKSQEAPKVKSLVRYCTRNNNEGYCHQVLADTRRPRKTDKAVAPAILQIEEMQRIGVEECQIDPAELTEERLLQEKKKSS